MSNSNSTLGKVLSSVGLSRPAGYSSNTGPKGVLSDSRQAAEDARDARSEAVRQTRAEQEARAITVPLNDKGGRARAREGILAARPESELYPRQQGADEVELDSLDLSKLDLSRLDLGALDLSPEELELLTQLRAEQAAEDAELAEWRAARREALRAGDVREIDTEEFLEAVEGEVAVLIYEDDAPRCQAVLDQAGVILRRHPAQHIVKITATALSFMTTEDGADEAVLPAVLVYRRGDLVAKHIRFEGDLERLLRSERLLPALAPIEDRDDI